MNKPKVTNYYLAKTSIGDTIAHTVNSRCKYAEVTVLTTCNAVQISQFKINSTALAFLRLGGGPLFTTPYLTAAITPGTGGDCFLLGVFKAGPSDTLVINQNTTTSNNWLLNVTEYY